MALIDFTGFDSEILNTYPTFFDGFSYSESVYDYSTETRFGSGRSLSFSNATAQIIKNLDNISTLICGFALKFPSPTYEPILIIGNADRMPQVSIRFVKDGTINVVRGDYNDTLLWQSGAGVYNKLVWNYIEVKVTLHNTTGSVVMRINESEVVSLTNQDTLYTGTINTISKVAFYGLVNNYFDDLYICDATGSVNNDFLGDVRIDMLRPSANGTTNNGTASAGSNYECVDEVESNDDTDYVTVDAVDEIELYEIENLPSTSYTKTIHGVRSESRLTKTDAGARNVNAVLRLNGSNYVNSRSDYTVPAEYANMLAVWETNPDDAAAFVEADVNSMESGIKVTA
jgi:hypothetical protein